jgi:hypothetical protein
MTEYFRKNADRLRQREREKYWKTFGMNQEKIDAARILQDGKCAICGVGMCLGSKDRNAQNADHDYQTMRFRALLCSNCNTTLGLMHDSPERLEAAARYLRHHAAFPNR